MSNQRTTTLLLSLLAATTLSAQNSGVSGRVTDSSRAPASGAIVQRTRTETGDHRQSLSSQEGYYNFPLLLPGSYEVKIEREGFQTQARAAIKVKTGSVSTVDVELAVGEVSQS